MKQLVFDIKRFAIHDGPGIRTTVFTKGCPLSCPWCQNPEGLHNEQLLEYFKSSCISCFRCVEQCPEKALSIASKGQHIDIDYSRCQNCGQCIEVCPSSALKFDAEWMSPEQVVEAVMKDEVFFQSSDGGVTFSGGDPLFCVDFIKECARLLKTKNVHIAIETSLMAAWEDIESVLGLVDLFIVDQKIIDKDKHDSIVGGRLEVIQSNLIKLAKTGKDILIRTPLIPAYTVDENNLQGIKKQLDQLRRINPRIKYEMLNFNPYAKAKYKKFKLDFDKVLENPKYSKEDIAEFKRKMGL